MEVREMKKNGIDVMVSTPNPVLIASAMYTGKHQFIGRGKDTEIPGVKECKVFDEERLVLYAFTCQYLEGDNYLKVLSTDIEIESKNTDYAAKIIEAYKEGKADVIIIDANPFTLVQLAALEIPFYVVFPGAGNDVFKDFLKRAIDQLSRDIDEIPDSIKVYNALWNTLYELYMDLPVPINRKIILGKGSYIQHAISGILHEATELYTHDLEEPTEV